MPIYAYRCGACGHAKDVLQKVTDPVLTVCPACGEPAFGKQVTAAGFHLKGSGWYASDFKSSGAPAAKKADKTDNADTTTKAEKTTDSRASAEVAKAAAPIGAESGKSAGSRGSSRDRP